METTKSAEILVKGREALRRLENYNIVVMLLRDVQTHNWF